MDKKVSPSCRLEHLSIHRAYKNHFLGGIRFEGDKVDKRWRVSALDSCTFRNVALISSMAPQIKIM